MWQKKEFTGLNALNKSAFIQYCDIHVANKGGFQ